MAILGSRSSSNMTRLFEQPLDKLFNSKAIKDIHEITTASASKSPPAPHQSSSAPLNSSTFTCAKLSRENSATKTKRPTARSRRFTIDATINTASLTASTSSNITNHQTGNECKPNEEEECCGVFLNVFPVPIRCLLNEIYLRGPSYVGVFRKSPNAKHCKELKQKLESPDFQQDEIKKYQVDVIASVFKEWLRSLPDCLLMSRLYPQWIDVAKLIEPLRLHYQQQQQIQRQQQQQSIDDALDTRLGINLSLDDNLNRNLTKSPNSSNGKTCLRPIKLALCRTTDNGQQQSSYSSAVSGKKQQFSRTRSCSIMTLDSGHSSTSSSPSPSLSSLDFGEVGAETRYGKHFQKARPKLRHQQHPARAASYPKGKCNQQRQQSQTHIEFGWARHISQPVRLETCLSNIVDQLRQSNNLSTTEFSLGERRFECIRVVRQLLETLNETNLILLRAVICVLRHIADNDSYNKMSSSNLGVCIGQSLLNHEQQHQLKNRGRKLLSFSSPTTSSSAQPAQTFELKHASPCSSNFSKRHRRILSHCLFVSTRLLTNLLHLSTYSSPTNPTRSKGHLASSVSSNCLDLSRTQEAAKYVPILVAFMIDHARELFGSDVINLFGPSRPRKQSDLDDNELVFNQSNSSECQRDAGSSQASLPSHFMDSSEHGNGSPPAPQPPVAVKITNRHVSPILVQHQSVDDHSLEHFTINTNECGYIISQTRK